MLYTIKLKIRINKSLIKTPINKLKIVFYDKDLLWDDTLNYGYLNGAGSIIVKFHTEQFAVSEQIDQFPDVYFKVFDNENCIYKSSWLKDIKVRTHLNSQFSTTTGILIDMGSFLIG